MAPEPAAPVRTGRARRFDPETEVALLLDATITVLRRNDYDEVVIADILDEAGLSTRSFYRHFDSKDELLLTLYQRDALAAADRLRTRVDRAATPPAKLEAWIDEILSFRYDKRKAERVALLGAASARRAEGYAKEATRSARLLATPLLELLEQGSADGSFPAADPTRDADYIRALVFDVAGLNAVDRGRAHAVQGNATQDILGFCLRALGAS
jgi:AcrR family transcriptional regulator